MIACPWQCLHGVWATLVGVGRARLGAWGAWGEGEALLRLVATAFFHFVDVGPP